MKLAYKNFEDVYESILRKNGQYDLVFFNIIKK